MPRVLIALVLVALAVAGVVWSLTAETGPPPAPPVGASGGDVPAVSPQPGSLQVDPEAAGVEAPVAPVTPDVAPAGAAPDEGAAPAPRSLGPPVGTREQPALAGSLLFHPSMEHSMFEVLYRRDGEARDRVLPLQSDGRFGLLRARSGLINLQVRLRGAREPLKMINGIGIPAGEEPRLQPVDVSMVRRLTIDVYDADRNPIEAPISFVAIPPGAEKARFRLEQEPRGQVRFVGRHPSYELHLWSTGYRAVQRQIRGDDAVVLERAARLRVEVRVPSGYEGQVPAPEVKLLDSTGKPTRRGTYVPRPGRPMAAAQVPNVVLVKTARARGSLIRTYSLNELGAYRVSWVLRPFRRRGPPPPALRGKAQTITVGAHGTVQNVVLEATAEQLRPRRQAKPAAPKQAETKKSETEKSGEGATGRSPAP